MMMNFTLSNQVQIPAVGIGTFMMTPDQAEQAVVDALACGYRMIDTAQAYMNERAVGCGIKRSGVAREDIFISTKIWASQYLTEGTVEKSLELLGTDYIDLMFIHQPAGDFMAGYRKLETVAIRPMVNQIEMHPYFAQEPALKVMEEYQIVPEAWAPLGGGRHNPFDNEMVKENRCRTRKDRRTGCSALECAARRCGHSEIGSQSENRREFPDMGFYTD